MTLPLGHIESHAGAGRHTTVEIVPQVVGRNRLTCAFRPLLALPHVLLVGAPTAFGISFGLRLVEGPDVSFGAGTGALGLVAGVAACISWFAIVFTGRHPRGLWDLAAFYLRWRVRAMTYVAMLRDEYPPFGDGFYPAHLELAEPTEPRNRLTTAFRFILLIPHFVALWLLSVMWAVTTIIAWFVILFTGRFPQTLYDYGVSVLRWSVRVEAYLLLLHDEYPPFVLE